VSRATGVSRRAIHAGLKELDAREVPTGLLHARVRRPGGGRKALPVHDPQMKEVLEALVDPDSRGDPESPLRWTCKSVRTLADELAARGHPIGRTRVAELLHELGYSLQSNRKTLEGSAHPDRDGQFRYLNELVRTAMDAAEPVISVDTKKKELVGRFKNAGTSWRPPGRAAGRGGARLRHRTGPRQPVWRL
jgi:transposase